MTHTTELLEQRLHELQRENHALREQSKQGERLRVMWENAVRQLKATRRELKTSNQELEERLAELERAKAMLERLSYSDQQVIENMREGVVITDEHGAIQSVNPAFERITGYPAKELAGQNPRVLQSGRHDATFYRYMWDELLERGRWQGEIWNKRKTGELYPTLLSISVIRDWNGQILNFIGVCTDISERKQMEEALRSSEERLRSITDILAEGVLLLDENEIIRFANPEASRLLGVSKEVLYGKGAREMLRLEKPRAHLFFHAKCPVLKSPVLSCECGPRDETLLMSDGTRLFISLVSRPVTHHQHLVGAVVSFHDISERRKAEEKLRTLYRAVEHSPAIVLITDPNGVIEYANPRFSTVTGYQPEEVLGNTLEILRAEDIDQAVYEEIWRTIGAGREWKGEVLNRKKSGELFWQMVSISPIRDDRGRITHFVAVEEDITERKRNEEQVWFQANYDALTELPNRRLFEDRLRQAMAQARASGEGLGLLFVDLDRFKQINDELGHAAGDKLLSQAARRMAKVIRSSDTLARLAGDEFTVILNHNPGQDGARRVAVHLLETLAKPFKIEPGVKRAVSGSIGIALYPEDADDCASLLQYADQAMYGAKGLGRNAFCFYAQVKKGIDKQTGQITP